MLVGGAGESVVKDFQDGDRIDLSAFVRSVGAVERRMSLDGDGVVIDLPGRSTTFTIEKVDARGRSDRIL